jgi:hypothetical protein
VNAGEVDHGTRDDEGSRSERSRGATAFIVIVCGAVGGAGPGAAGGARGATDPEDGGDRLDRRWASLRDLQTASFLPSAITGYTTPGLLPTQRNIEFSSSFRKNRTNVGSCRRISTQINTGQLFERRVIDGN